MSVASRITAIEEHIGDIYDTLEIAGTTETTKNIVNINSNLKDRYKYFLNNGVEIIWNNWEKVIGEGTEFTLENTIQAPMKINLKGNTYQNSTTGKNLFDKDSITVSNHYIDVNGGTTSAPDWLCTYDYVKIEPNTDYIVSFENMGARFIWAEYDENKTCIGNRHENTTGAIQTSSTAKYIRFCTNKPNATILQVEEGTTATTPEEYTGGIASPNPDYPQDIQVVSGDNIVEVVGKNLFDLDWFTFRTNNGITATKGDGYVLLNGTATATAFINYAIPINLGTSATNYWYVKSDSTGIMIKVKRIGQNDINITPTAGTQMQQGIGNNISYVYDGYIQITNGTTLNNCKVYIDVRNNYSSLQDYVFEPYNGDTYELSLGDIKMRGIGNYEDYFVRNSGKNLFDESNMYLGYYEITPPYSLTSNNAYRTMIIDNLPKGTYTFKTTLNNPNLLRIMYDNENHLIGQNVNTYTFTTTTNGKVMLSFRNQSSSVITETFYTMLNEGTTALPYEPYGTGKWYLHKEIGKVVLDGSSDESWSEYGNAGVTNKRFITTISDIIGENNSKVFCNYFTQGTNAQNNFIQTFASKYVWFGSTSLQDLDVTGFKTWLSTHNTEVYYVLATPTYTEITDTTLLSQLEAIYKAISHDDQTNISQVNNDMPFKLEVTALKNI